MKEGDFDQYIQSAKDYINKDNDCEQIKEHSNEDTQEQDGSLMDFDAALSDSDDDTDLLNMLNNNSAVSKSVNQTNYWNKFIGHHSDATVEVSARADDDKLISFIKLEMGKKKSSTITKSSENKLGCKKPHNKEHDREHMFFER